ncbi:MAG: class Ib ribonucleoside-diphosphate reductase assembly flavoprotein NrdI [Defluviitaleaceae bacterium]|nr:class Ib ribonucleoside-diphosphate reductase assembly flavoprotein NrdI [Defluviitaleaceae bacterium]
MKIVYMSITGKVHAFLKKTNFTNLTRIITGKELISEPYILVTGTIGMGEIAPELDNFLTNNYKNLKAVVGSGNKNWGDMYCKAAYTISERYNIRLLMTFESAGNKHDVSKFNDLITNYKDIPTMKI